MKLTQKQLKRIIKEELSEMLYEEEDFTRQLGDMFSRSAEEIVMAIEMAYSMGLTPDQLPFEKLDLSRQNIPNHTDLLRVAEVFQDTYGNYIVSYLRRHFVSAIETLKTGHRMMHRGAADRIRNIIKNEITKGRAIV